MWRDWLIIYLNLGLNSVILFLFLKILYKIEIKYWQLALFIAVGAIIPGTILIFFDTVYKPVIFIIFYIFLTSFLLKLKFFRSLIAVSLLYFLVLIGEVLFFLIFIEGLGHSLETLHSSAYQKAAVNMIINIPPIIFLLIYKYIYRGPNKEEVVMRQGLNMNVYDDFNKKVLVFLAIVSLMVACTYVFYLYNLFLPQYIQLLIFFSFIAAVIIMFFHNYKFVSKNYENEKLIELNKRLEEELNKRKQTEEELQKAHDLLEIRVAQRTEELKNVVQNLSSEIQERKRIEKALLESEEHYRQIVELLPSAILVQIENEIVFVNSAALKLLNMEHAEQLIGKYIVEYIQPELTHQFEEKLKKVKQENINFRAIRSKIVQSNGKNVHIEVSMTPFNYQGKKAVQIVIANITHRKKIEQELVRASKLDTIALLAGGIAHDFNNILTIILGNISLAKVYKNNEEKLLEKLTESQKAIEQARELSCQLQTFARGGDPVKTIESIEQLVKDVTAFTLSGSNVQCEFSFSDDLLLVEIDKGQISQVINNLVLNAVQAMPGGGTIKISIENSNIHDTEGPEFEKVQYLKITIKDQGIGIEKENLKQVFEPFYSTKERGTGLGMAISDSIVKKHKGHIYVESEAGRGTTITIYLPATVKKRLPSLKRESLYSGEGKVLIMDDNEEVRSVLGEMLVQLGYTVSNAKNGEEAIKIFNETINSHKSFDSIIMDLTVSGGLGGEETMERILKMDPEVKAIVSSGYSDNKVMSNYRSYGFKGIIKKPYKIEELSCTLYEVIHSRAEDNTEQYQNKKSL